MDHNYIPLSPSSPNFQPQIFHNSGNDSPLQFSLNSQPSQQPQISPSQPSTLKNLLSNRMIIYILFILVLVGNYHNMRKIASNNKLDFNRKNPKENYEDQVKIIMVATLYWFLTDSLYKSDSLGSEMMYRGIFMSAMLLMSNTYGFIEKKTKLNVSLQSGDGAKKLLFYVGFPIIITIVLYLAALYKVFVSPHFKEVKYNVGMLCTVIIVGIALYATAYKLSDNTSKIILHPHHWAIFLILSLMAASMGSIKLTNTIPQQALKVFGIFLSGLAFGASFHGMVYYGISEFALNADGYVGKKDYA